jgi:hypothetical protein
VEPLRAPVRPVAARPFGAVARFGATRFALAAFLAPAVAFLPRAPAVALCRDVAAFFAAAPAALRFPGVARAVAFPDAVVFLAAAPRAVVARFFDAPPAARAPFFAPVARPVRRAPDCLVVPVVRLVPAVAPRPVCATPPEGGVARVSSPSETRSAGFFCLDVSLDRSPLGIEPSLRAILS